VATASQITIRLVAPSRKLYNNDYPLCFLDIGIRSMANMSEPFILRIGGLHRLKPEWLTSYQDYNITAEIFYGTRWMGKSETGAESVRKSEGNLFFNTLVVNKWIKFDYLPVCILPRECRVVFTLYGRKLTEEGSTSYETEELGWASMQCFNFKG